MKAVRQFGERGHRVDGSIEDKFRPLGWPRVLQSHGFQSGRADQIGGFLHHRKWRVRRLERAHPRRGVELVLNVCVAVARAAHKRCAANHKSLREISDDFLTAKSVLRRENSAILEEM